MKTYIYPYSPLAVTLQTLVSQDLIVLRSFQLSGGALNRSLILSSEEARSFLSQPVDPFVPSRSTPKNSWIPRDAIEGRWVGGPAGAEVGSFLQEISQLSFVLDSNILGSAALSEHAEWIVPCNPDGRLSMPINRTLLTRPARSHKTAIYQDMQQNTAITVMMPYADSNFSRAVIYAKLNPAYGLVHNFLEASVVSPDGITFDGYETLSKVEGIWPTLQVSGPGSLASQTTASCCVTIHHPDTGFRLEETGMRVEVEATAGYLAHRVVELRNGTATFTISALGLSPGEQIKLKAGWRNYPGAVEKIITVV